MVESGDAANYCPKGAILVYASRRVRSVVRDCDRWPCPACGPRRARVVAAHAAAGAPGALYAAELAEADWKAATRAAQRQGIDRLSVRRVEGGGLLVATAPLQARSFAWSLAEVDPAELVDLLLTQRIRRVDWSAGWRPEPEAPRVGSSGDHLVARVACGPKRIDAVLAQAGVVNGRVTVPPATAAARIITAAQGGRRRPSERLFTTRPA